MVAFKVYAHCVSQFVSELEIVYESNTTFAYRNILRHTDKHVGNIRKLIEKV